MLVFTPPVNAIRQGGCDESPGLAPGSTESRPTAFAGGESEAK